MATKPEAVPVSAPEHGNAYNIFILVLTILSLVVMVLIILPLDPATLQVLQFYDNLICVIFLVDFTLNMIQTKPTRVYFIKRRGWLDLLGSIPSLGVLRVTALLRLARLSRLARIRRLMGGQAQKQLVDDVLQNRGQYALFITVLLTIIVLTASSVVMVQVEGRSPDANITTGGDALWWSFVTITTVGYGDFYPVTGLGRTIAVFVMFAGVGIIGSLASILASILVPPVPTETETEPESAESGSATAAAGASGDGAIEAELAAIRSELTAMRELLASRP
jgi:voltage-gated potassium channel